MPTQSEPPNMGRGRASSAGGTSGGSIQPHSGQQQPLHASGPIPFSINPWHHDDAQNDQNHDGLQYYSNNVVPQNQRYGCIRLVLVDEVAARNSNPMAEYDQLAQFDQLLSIAAWYATLEINSLDLPSLFEQGLYWSSVNRSDQELVLSSRARRCHKFRHGVSPYAAL